LGYERLAGAELLDGTSLRRDLTALAHAEHDADRRRKAALAHVKSVFREARSRVAARIGTGALPGLRAAHALCEIQDVLLQVLYDFATKHFYYAQNPTESERLAIVATGGYGRGLLAPASDIDLLFLRPFKQTAWGESVIELILLMLWDLGLKVGQATRSLGECARLARDDMTIRTALLDSRFVAGEAALCQELRRRYRTEIAAGAGRDFVEAKLAERDARHRRQGESRYLVEPNVKEGKGGLRDLQTLYWMGKYLYHVDDPADLVDRGVFTREEHKTFHAAEAFLWDVRCQLHDLTGRAEDRLSFDLQPRLAQRMGFADADPRRAVERFMRAYFLVAKDVGDLTRIFCAVLEEQNRKRRPALALRLRRFHWPLAAGDDFYVENGRLNARDTAFEADPTNLIRIFHVADAKGVDIHPHALRAITRSLDHVGDAVREDREANRLFLEILTSRQDPERALRRMNEAGVLGRFVPPFAHAVALMQFNMYHHYTVDEHLIRAVGVLASIEHGAFKAEHPLASELIGRIRARDALYCAVFLHDIAKGLKGSHSEIGAEAAQSLCPRWGLSPGDTEIVVWLVRHHLVMSDTAQRRDISDPKTVRDFAMLVQSPERLRLLLVLTVADIRAVGPGVWNGWKGQLLRDLYREAEVVMSGAASGPSRGARIAQAKETLARNLADWPHVSRDAALAQFQDNYWLAFTDVQIERHARLRAATGARQDPFGLEAERDAFRAVGEITIFASDRPGLFSRLAGAIMTCGGSVVEAKAFTTNDGFVLDAFSVQDAQGGPFGEAEQLARLRRAIGRSLAGESLPRSRAIRRPGQNRAAAFDVRARVNIDNDASATTSVIEVEGADRPGLLFDVAHAIFAQRLSISSAIVATYGERVVDVFYVRDEFGHKIVHPDRMAGLKDGLLSVLLSRS
jgi:[protein-PII] uridylyltransferase